MTDTSTEAVERLAHDCDLAKGALKDDFPSGQAIFGDCAATLRALSTRVQELELEQAKLIENALQHYKSPNPNKCRFDLAMHAITEQRNGRKAADALWQEIDAECKQPKAMVGVIGQLEWTSTDGEILRAHPLHWLDGYIIVTGGGRVSWQFTGDVKWHYVESVELAKFAAQADYEARIRSAFVTPPQDAIAKAVKAERDAERYQWLRNRNIDTVHRGGVFAGVTPDNYVLNGDDLDRHIDAAIRKRKETQS